ncbi:unnamed protein product [Adineta steineri]|uniref:Uncharacterized protein n=1 Tax=Adineta steineri TaxID=433720 RepID=A0A814LVH4_9BILA|nr:unnamed protein product [Adineta steineri]CAF1071423.1 unnamed protein product [Adineta steineri]
MYPSLLIDKQLNSTFTIRLLNTGEDISEDLCRILHTFTVILLLISRYVSKLNLLDYFYSVFFGKNSIVSFF